MLATKNLVARPAGTARAKRRRRGRRALQRVSRCRRVLCRAAQRPRPTAVSTPRTVARWCGSCIHFAIMRMGAAMSRLCRLSDSTQHTITASCDRLNSAKLRVPRDGTIPSPTTASPIHIMGISKSHQHMSSHDTPNTWYAHTTRQCCRTNGHRRATTINARPDPTTHTIHMTPRQPNMRNAQLMCRHNARTRTMHATTVN